MCVLKSGSFLMKKTCRKVETFEEVCQIIYIIYQQMLVVFDSCSSEPNIKNTTYIRCSRDK